jgi:hypothetical protein
MRLALIPLLALVIAGCGDEQDTASPASDTELVVRVDADGTGPAPAQELRVSCSEPGPACRAAEKLAPEDFAPVPADKACTQIFGGPETASVKGRLHGEPVAGRFARSNGCEMARWESVSALLAEVK